MYQNKIYVSAVTHFSGSLAEVFRQLTAFWRNTLPTNRNTFFFISSTHKFSALSILTRHLPHTCAHNFCSVRCDSKTSTYFFFFLHNFADRRQSYNRSQQPQHTIIFSLLIRSRNFTLFIQRRGNIFTSFSLAYLNCQHHYFCSLGQKGDLNTSTARRRQRI